MIDNIQAKKIRVLYITGNKAKVGLAQDRLSKYGIMVRQQSFQFNEIQNIDVEKVAIDKAHQIINKVSENFIIEDTAFYIDALNGFPGTILRTAFETLGDHRIARLVQDELNKKALLKSILVFGNPLTKKLKIFTGIYEGEIANEPRGEQTLGMMVTRIFIPNGWNKTLAELSNNEREKFLDEIKNNDHYEQFGKWISNGTKWNE